MDKVDELLEKTCYVIDFLPRRVAPNEKGHFFDVEYYLLNSEKRIEMKNRFVNVILKLMCYYSTSILWNGWNHHPDPAMIDQAISEIMENHSGMLHVLFPDENTLLIFEWDCLNLSVYNPSNSMLALLDKIACSEGLFLWRS